jgi:DNA-binding transcriptional ArsR family regulator
MSLNAVSKHIKYLERARLVVREIDGSYHRISINRDEMVKAAKWLSLYVPFWVGNLRNLKTYVESK